MLESVKNSVIRNKALIVICIIGLILRLFYLWEYSQLPDWEQLTVDNNFHHHWALSILDGNLVGDTTYFRAPFYMFYLALIYKIFGISLWTVRICGLFLGLLSIVLTYLIAKRIFSKETALIAGAIHMLYPIIYYFESELLLDAFFMLLLQSAILFFMKWWDTRSIHSIILSGLFLSVASITRPTALLLIPLCLFTIILVERRNVKRLLLILLLFSFTVSSALSLTFYRNMKVASDPVLIASQGGINLYLGNNDAADGLSAVMPEPLGFNWRIKQISFIAEQAEGRQLKPGEISDYWTGQAIDWISSNQTKFITLYLKKLFHSISSREISNNRYLDDFFDKVFLLKYNYLSFGVLFSLTVMSCIVTGLQNKKLLFLVCFILLYIAAISLFFFTSRFRLPLLPFYIIIAAQSLYYLRLKIRESKKSASIFLSVTVLIGLISFFPLVPLPKGTTTDLMISKGIFYTAQADYDTAFKLFSAAYKNNPNLAELNLNIGAMYIHRGQLDSAVSYFYREIALHPKEHKAYNNLSSVFFTQMKYREALAEAHKALDIAPYDLIANQLLVRAVNKIDTTEKAGYLRQSIQQAVHRTGNNIYLMNEAAVYLSNRSLFSQAESLLTKAASSSPPPIEIDDASFLHDSPHTPKKWKLQIAQSYYQLGYINGLQGSFSQAILYSKKAIELDPLLAEAYVNLVSGYLSTGESVQGINLLQSALMKFPDNPNLLKIQQLINR